MTDLLLHPNTKQILDSLVDNPKQTILILGEKGSGKHTVVLNLASRLLNVDHASLPKQPYFKLISGDEAPITIEAVRAIQNFVKLKVPSKSQRPNRVVLIENAANMGTEAQNALLKLIEEPPMNTVIILSATNESGLLDTVVSRVIKVSVLPVSKSQAVSYFNDSFNKSDIAKAYAVSGGRAGLLSSILSDTNHPLLSDIAEAKLILSEQPRMRLLRVDELSKDKVKVKNLVEALRSIAYAALLQAASAKNATSASAWLERLEATQKTNAMLSSNVNAKLLLDDLFIKL